MRPYYVHRFASRCRTALHLPRITTPPRNIFVRTSEALASAIAGVRGTYVPCPVKSAAKVCELAWLGCHLWLLACGRWLGVLKKMEEDRRSERAATGLPTNDQVSERAQGKEGGLVTKLPTALAWLPTTTGCLPQGYAKRALRVTLRVALGDCARGRRC